MSMPTLTRAGLDSISNPLVSLPTNSMLALPERVVQFGTGAFLRGFVDSFIDDANRRGTFDGRIVAIGSTASGRDRAFADQNGLYTLVSAGEQAGLVVSERRVVGAVSRALSAATEWDAVLEIARDPRITLVFSNTTEAGIALDDRDDAALRPPYSFPAKLTRFLAARATAASYAGATLTVIPCELVEHNGDRLRALVREQAVRWALGHRFLGWLDDTVQFCNTLVDRIVPGTPAKAEHDALCTELGYRDELLTVAEPYALFVIEGGDALASRLGFARGAPQIRVVADLQPYRERKVRILNGAHTAMAALGLLGDIATVRDAMNTPALGTLLHRLVLTEIAPVLDVPDATEFAEDVLQRFRNPYVQHRLLDIAMQSTLKFRVRLLPVLRRHLETAPDAVPPALTLAFAAQLVSAHPAERARQLAVQGTRPTDTLGDVVQAHWEQGEGGTLVAFVEAVLSDDALWEGELRVTPALVEAVADHIASLKRDGVHVAIARVLQAQEPATYGSSA